MQYYEWLLLIAGGITALTTISVFIKKIVQKIKKIIAFFKNMNDSVHRQETEGKKAKKQLEELTAKVETLEEHSEENYMGVLQLRIMSNEMPIEERLRAGERYVNNHGNGAVKAKYKQLQREYGREEQET